VRLLWAVVRSAEAVTKDEAQWQAMFQISVPLHVVLYPLTPKQCGHLNPTT
jgi:hypothetical protein